MHKKGDFASLYTINCTLLLDAKNIFNLWVPQTKMFLSWMLWQYEVALKVSDYQGEADVAASPCCMLSWKKPSNSIIENSIFISVLRSDCKRVKAGFAVGFVSTTSRVGGSWDEKWFQLEAAKTDVQDFGSEVAAIELPCKVKHNNSTTVLSQIDGTSARYFWILPQKKTASMTRPWKDVPAEAISAWTAARLHREWVTPLFFFFNCHSGLLTVCAGVRVPPQLKGQTRILKVTLLEPNNPRLRADFFFFLEAAWVPGSATHTMQPHSFLSVKPGCDVGAWFAPVLWLGRCEKSWVDFYIFIVWCTNLITRDDGPSSVKVKGKKKANRRHNFSFRKHKRLGSCVLIPQRFQWYNFHHKSSRKINVCWKECLTIKRKETIIFVSTTNQTMVWRNDMRYE